MRTRDQIMEEFGKLVQKNSTLGKAYSNPEHCFGDPDSLDLNTPECVRCASNSPEKHQLCKKYAELTVEARQLGDESVPSNVCSIADCGKPIKAKGLCEQHYSQFSRGKRKRVVKKGGKLVAEDHSPAPVQADQTIQIMNESESEFILRITTTVRVAKKDIKRIAENISG